MTQKLIEKMRGPVPILPEEWRRLGPFLSGDLNADYLLIDTGPVVDEVRYIVVELRTGRYKLHFCGSLTQVHDQDFGGGGTIQSSLLVPLNRAQPALGHVGALFRDGRGFGAQDIHALRQVADRFLTVMAGYRRPTPAPTG